MSVQKGFEQGLLPSGLGPKYAVYNKESILFTIDSYDGNIKLKPSTLEPKPSTLNRTPTPDL